MSTRSPRQFVTFVRGLAEPAREELLARHIQADHDVGQGRLIWVVNPGGTTCGHQRPPHGSQADQRATAESVGVDPTTYAYGPTRRRHGHLIRSRTPTRPVRGGRRSAVGRNGKARDRPERGTWLTDGRGVDVATGPGPHRDRPTRRRVRRRSSARLLGHVNLASSSAPRGGRNSSRAGWGDKEKRKLYVTAHLLPPPPAGAGVDTARWELSAAEHQPRRADQQ